MSKRLLILVLLVVASSVVAVLWQRQHSLARAAKLEVEIVKGLTADEIKLVLEGQAKADRSSVYAIIDSAATRQAFLNGMRQYLALAAQARREGFAEEPRFKINFEYKKNLMLAGLYKAKLSEGQPKPYAVPETEIKGLLSDPNNVKEFETTMETLRAIQNAALGERGAVSLAPRPEGEKLVEAREAWARTKIVAAKAQSDSELIQRPEIRLRLKILEAGILANDYLQKNWSPSIRATDQEIADYLASHPEFDLRKKLEKAETVLRRARAGEEFSKLAEEFSEDRATKENGGLHENIPKGYLWVSVENAALGLEKGQVADRLVESEVGYHIVKLENKRTTKAKDGSETVRYDVRHILFQKKFEEVNSKNPNVPPPFMSAEEIARAQVEAGKRAKFVGDIIQRNPIQLPDDFQVQLSETKSASRVPETTGRLGR